MVINMKERGKQIDKKVNFADEVNKNELIDRSEKNIKKFDKEFKDDRVNKEQLEELKDQIIDEIQEIQKEIKEDKNNLNTEEHKTRLIDLLSIFEAANQIESELSKGQKQKKEKEEQKIDNGSSDDTSSEVSNADQQNESEAESEEFLKDIDIHAEAAFRQRFLIKKGVAMFCSSKKVLIKAEEALKQINEQRAVDESRIQCSDGFALRDKLKGKNAKTKCSATSSDSEKSSAEEKIQPSGAKNQASKSKIEGGAQGAKCSDFDAKPIVGKFSSKIEPGLTVGEKEDSETALPASDEEWNAIMKKSGDMSLLLSIVSKIMTGVMLNFSESKIYAGANLKPGMLASITEQMQDSMDGFSKAIRGEYIEEAQYQQYQEELGYRDSITGPSYSLEEIASA